MCFQLILCAFISGEFNYFCLYSQSKTETPINIYKATINSFYLFAGDLH